MKGYKVVKEYFEKYYSRIVLMGLFVFLIHGAKLHSGIIGIDTEDLIHIQKDFYGGWLNTGRQGLYLWKWLTDSLNFQPYMAGLMTLVFLTAAVSAFFLLWDKVTGRRSSVLAWMAGGLFLLSHPVLTEQLYFTLQSVEISIALLSTVIVLYLITGFREAGGIWRLVLGILLLVLNFSVYQAFVVVFIFGTVSLLLAESINRISKEVVAGKELCKGMLPYLGVFLIAFLINSVITKLFFSVSDYLNGQILWGKFEVMDNFRAIVGHILKVFTGCEGIHYHASFGLLCIMVLGMVVSAVFSVKGRAGKKSGIAVILFYLAALLTTPFLMTVLCGGAPVIRSQLVLPLLTGFLAYLVVGSLVENGRKEERNHVITTKAVALFTTFICVVGIWSQTATTMSLYYTDEMRYEQDVALGRELITEIEKVRGGADLPIAIVGRKPFVGNHACVTGEIIGKSFFDHDVEVEPQFYWSTRRMLGFLHVLGADYNQAAKKQFPDAVTFSENMPIWPTEGSVQLYDGIIIVKLSEAN